MVWYRYSVVFGNHLQLTQYFLVPSLLLSIPVIALRQEFTQLTQVIHTQPVKVPLWQDSWHYLIINQLGGSGVDSASLF
jgi:hypothetical protein